MFSNLDKGRVHATHAWRSVIKAPDELLQLVKGRFRGEVHRVARGRTRVLESGPKRKLR